MTYINPSCPMYASYATQANELPIVYDSLSRPIICWAGTGRTQYFHDDSGVTLSGVTFDPATGQLGRGRDITLESGRSYYVWARPLMGASAANTSIECGIYIKNTNTQLGTTGRGQTGQSLRLMTEIYGPSAAAVILPTDFTGPNMIIDIRFTTITGTWNGNAGPVSGNTNAQGRGTLVIYSTPAGV